MHTGSKVWLITGSSRGLGRAFAQAALDAGHRVVATARNPLQLSDLVGNYGDRVRALALDVTSEAQGRYAIDTAIETFGGLDVLVNNAGYGNVCPVEDTSLADFRAQIETNLFGVIIMTKAVLPYFRERKAGHIIQVTSIAGRIGPAGRAPYAAAKFVSTVGAAVRFQRSYDGKQPGDPARAAEVLLHVASLSEPPLRLLLGSDSYAAAQKSALDKIESDRHSKDLSFSTDY